MLKLSDLSLEQKIGQILCLGWMKDESGDADGVNDHARVCIEEMQCGGLVMMARNMRTPEQSIVLTQQIQSLAQIPLFLSTDQEGGLVNRMVNPLTAFPGNMALGATRSEDFAYRCASAVAKELRAVGVNWNFAPVVDVNNNAANPVIGTRSFGADPELVARMGTAVVKGYQENGILACAKHFPGHGDTNVDSHLALPVVPFERERLEQVEFLPFRQLAKANVAAMMTSHITFSAIDPERPATLSPAILTKILRTEMGYEGIIITDCLEMKAISNTIGTIEGVKMAIKAGADIVLVCHTLEVQRAAHRALIEAVTSGEIEEATIDRAVERILKAKEWLFESGIETPIEPWKNPEHQQLECEITNAAVTIIRDNASLPLQVSPNATIGVISLHSAGERLAEAIAEHHAKVELVKVSQVAQAKILGEHQAAETMANTSITLNEEEAHRLVEKSEVIILATCLQETKNYRPEQLDAQLTLIRKIAASHSKVIGVALREPYDLMDFSKIKTYLTAYGYRPYSLKAIADTLFGLNEARGKLPV